jgi:hypothetical protein
LPKQKERKSNLRIHIKSGCQDLDSRFCIYPAERSEAKKTERSEAKNKTERSKEKHLLSGAKSNPESLTNEIAFHFTLSTHHFRALAQETFITKHSQFIITFAPCLIPISLITLKSAVTQEKAAAALFTCCALLKLQKADPTVATEEEAGM